MTTYNPNQDAHYQILQEMLIEARQARGMFQKDVAERIEKKQSHISKYEGGERKLDWIEVLQLIEIFELSEVDFLMEFQRRVFEFNESTQTKVLQNVAKNAAKKARVRAEIVKLMRENSLSFSDLAEPPIRTRRHKSNR